MIQGTKIYIDFLPLLNKLPQTYSIKYKFGGQSLKLVFESFFLLEALGKNLLSSFWRLLLLTHAPFQFSSVQLLSRVPTLCDPKNRSTPGLPVHHQLPEFTQTYVHRVHDAIQPSHLLSSPSPPAPNPSQHQSLFQ